MHKLRKHRQNENGSQSASNTRVKQVAARTSIQQTQGSNILFKKENPNRRSYLNK